MTRGDVARMRNNTRAILNAKGTRFQQPRLSPRSLTRGPNGTIGIRGLANPRSNNLPNQFARNGRQFSINPRAQARAMVANSLANNARPNGRNAVNVFRNQALANSLGAGFGPIGGVRRAFYNGNYYYMNGRNGLNNFLSRNGLAASALIGLGTGYYNPWLLGYGVNGLGGYGYGRGGYGYGGYGGRWWGIPWFFSPPLGYWGYNSFYPNSYGSGYASYNYSPVADAPLPQGVTGQVVIRNPDDNGEPVNFSVGDKDYTLRSDYRRTFSLGSDSYMLISFNRGEDLGEARYKLIDGVYKFVITPDGWDLVRDTGDQPAASIPDPKAIGSTADANAGAFVTILNPEENGATLNYMVDDQQVEMKPGQMQEIPLTGHNFWTVSFDRGGDAGPARYKLTEGQYKFVPTEQGWDLVADDFDVKISNRGNDKPFHVVVDGDNTTIEPDSTQTFTTNRPLYVMFGREEDQQPARKRLDKGTYQVGVNADTKLLDLFPVEEQKTASKGDRVEE